MVSRSRIPGLIIFVSGWVLFMLGALSVLSLGSPVRTITYLVLGSLMLMGGTVALRPKGEVQFLLCPNCEYDMPMGSESCDRCGSPLDPELDVKTK